MYARKKSDWYKARFHNNKGPSRDVVLYKNMVEIDPWIKPFILHSVGIKSKKRRIIKKALKRYLSYLLGEFIGNRKIVIGTSCHIIRPFVFFNRTSNWRHVRNSINRNLL